MDAPYGMLYHTWYKRVVGPPIRSATRQEWLDSLDTHGWPTHMISTIAGVGHRVVAVIGGPHQENAPDECTCRCQQGHHCGGCSHEGCGYTA